MLRPGLTIMNVSVLYPLEWFIAFVNRLVQIQVR